ncbi:MAG: 2Fe-2S iron-sulfur cluster-binding protein [Bacteroidota bacterium]
MDRTVEFSNRSVVLKIDGKEVQAFQGQNLVDVARENGVYIPTLCHFPNIHPPAASCRVCMVKINGRFETGCTQKVSTGMDVEVNSPDVIDCRKANIEMLFAEGSHFCPSCSKSGNCELQRKGYENGLNVSRFPHFFEDRPRDYKPSRIVMEHSRCIQCKRCVERVRTEDGERVFYFKNRGHKTLVGVDYVNEKKLSEEEAIAAMNICPVGAILVRGECSAKPFGLRKYDVDKDIVNVPLKTNGNGNGVKPAPGEKKKIVATTSLAGCFGCHMSLLDIDLDIVEIFDLVEFNKSPLTDIKKFTKECDVGIIEGGVANSENFEVLKEFRKKCKVLIALGECSIWGGIPAIRNSLPVEECLEEAYLDSITSCPDNRVIPYHEDIPKILDQVHGCNEIVKIDYYISGCPPNPNYIWKVVKNILYGTDLPINYPEFKYD